MRVIEVKLNGRVNMAGEDGTLRRSLEHPPNEVLDAKPAKAYPTYALKKGSAAMDLMASLKEVVDTAGLTTLYSWHPQALPLQRGVSKTAGGNRGQLRDPRPC